MKRLTSILMTAVVFLGMATSVLVPATSSASPADDITNGIQAAGGSNTTGTTGFTGALKTIVQVLLFLLGAIAVIMIVIGGIRYTISNGDQSSVQSAKNTILYAVIGLGVALLAYAIVNFVVSTIGGGH